MRNTLTKRGSGLIAIAATASIALLSGCGSVASIDDNTKGLDSSSTIPVAFSNNRSFFDLTDLQKEKAKKEKIVDNQTLPPIMDLRPIGGREELVVKPLPKSRPGNLLKYKVKRGDTLSHVAVAYKVGIDELAEWNTMNKKDTLFIGKVLTLPPGAVNPNGPVRSLSGKSKNTRYYTVKKGDTLGHIALREKCTVADLKKWNNMSNDRIFAGKKLSLGKGGKVSKASVNPGRNSVPKNGIHTVKPGQSLSTIAYRYDMSISELKRLNGLTTSHIVPDQKLYLRDGVAKSGASTAKAWINPKPAKLDDGNKYTVRKGDILDRIANKFGITAKRIMQTNGLSSTLIRQGQVLVIPTVGPGRSRPKPDSARIGRKNYGPKAGAATTVAKTSPKVNTDKYVKLPHFVDQQNDTLEIIAEMYGSKAEWIMAANPGVRSNTDLRSMKEISVPVEDLSVK